MLNTPYSQEVSEALAAFTRTPAAYLHDKRINIANQNVEPGKSDLEIEFNKKRVRVASFIAGHSASVSVSSPGKVDGYGVGIDYSPFIYKKRKLPGLVLTNLTARAEYDPENGGELGRSHVAEDCLGFENTIITLKKVIGSREESLIEVPGLLSTRVYNPTVTGISKKGEPNNHFGWNVGYTIYRPVLDIKHQGRERFTFPPALHSPEEIIDRIAQSVLNQLGLH